MIYELYALIYDHEIYNCNLSRGLCQEQELLTRVGFAATDAVQQWTRIQQALHTAVFDFDVAYSKRTHVQVRFVSGSPVSKAVFRLLEVC